jgi:virulence-associated protein VagC
MSARAKLFKSGRSQAVLLPEAFSFPNQTEVGISREGNRVILEPLRREWSPEFLALFGSAPDFELPPDLPCDEPAPEFD